MNIFEENRKKYQAKSKKEFAILSLSIMGGSGVVFLIGIPLSFFIIGIPLVIFGLIGMALGAICLIASPFVKIKPQS